MISTSPRVQVCAASYGIPSLFAMKRPVACATGLGCTGQGDDYLSSQCWEQDLTLTLGDKRHSFVDFERRLEEIVGQLR